MYLKQRVDLVQIKSLKPFIISFCRINRTFNLGLTAGDLKAVFFLGKVQRARLFFHAHLVLSC